MPWLNIYFSQGEEGAEDCEHIEKHGLRSLVDLINSGGVMPSDEEMEDMEWKEKEPFAMTDEREWVDGVLCAWNSRLGYFSMQISRP